MYGRANANGRRTARLYQITFPDRQQPYHSTFSAVYRRVAETGSVISQTADRGKPKVARTPDLQKRILQHVAEDPGISTRQLAVEFPVSHSTAWRIFHEQLLHPYHLQRVQSLVPDDYPPRENFFVQQTANPWFVSSVLFTDEATFSRSIINFHNQHLWADENPQGIIQARHQQQFKINVWAGIVGDCLISPYDLPQHLIGNIYRDFIVNILPVLLDNVPLAIRATMWFMHDGAPAHFSRIVRDVLNNIVTSIAAALKRYSK